MNPTPHSPTPSSPRAPDYGFTCSTHYREHLSQGDLHRLAAELLPLYQSGFGQKGGGDQERCNHLQDLYEHLDQGQRLSLLQSADRAMGFCVSRVHETSCGRLYHLGGVILAPAAQGKGVGKRILRTELLDTDADLLCFHTQSKAMLGAARSVITLRDDLRDLAAIYVASQDLRGGIDRARYGGRSLYGDQTMLQQIALDGVDVARGDALFVVGTVRKEVL